MDMSKFNPNAPAFGEGAQNLEELTGTPVEPVGDAGGEKETEPVAPQITTTETEEEAEAETQVPYSRFKKFHDLGKDKEREAEEWRIKYEQVLASKTEPQAQSTVAEMPDYWVELYGDSEASQRAFQVMSRQNQELIENAKQAAFEALQNAQTQEQNQLNENLSAIDDGLEGLGDYAGHALSEQEQSVVLDIVDEFTPKDGNDNYIGAPLPFEKAWDIYQLRQNAGKAPMRKSRDQVAALAGTNSQGEPNLSDEQQKNADFNPFAWDAWRKRL